MNQVPQKKLDFHLKSFVRMHGVAKEVISGKNCVGLEIRWFHEEKWDFEPDEGASSSKADGFTKKKKWIFESECLELPRKNGWMDESAS